MKHLMLMLAPLGLAQLPLFAQTTFSDANWVSLGGGIPGVNGNVYAAAVDRAGNLYVGGAFSMAGGVFANNVAEWNGSSWSALGSGISGTGADAAGPYVSALAFDAKGNLYAAGDFDTAGGASANSIAQWNGNSWSVLGLGIHGSVSALIIAGTNLFAGGHFSTAGAVSAINVAEWSDNAWSALGLGTGGDSYGGSVYCLALDSFGNLYAGGSFDTAGGVLTNNVAEWAGGAWSALGSGLGDNVCALAVSGTNLFAAATTFYSQQAGYHTNYVAQWNGSSWLTMGSWSFGPRLAFAYTPPSLAVSGNNLFAGGMPGNLSEWNGSSWSALGSGVNGGVSAFALDTYGNLYVGGSFTTAGTNVSFNIAKALLTGPTPNHLLLASAGVGTNVITYLGIPGASYALDLATNFTPPINWMPQTTNTASTANATTAGYLSFTNPNHLPQAYYRTRWVP